MASANASTVEYFNLYLNRFVDFVIRKKTRFQCFCRYIQMARVDFQVKHFVIIFRKMEFAKYR